MHREFSGSFPDYTIFICKFKNDECFIFHEMFLVYKLETLENCMEAKHIMIMIIAIIYISLSWYFINSWKSLSENPQPPPSEKTHSFLFTHSTPLKIQKVQVHPLLANNEHFQAPLPMQKGQGGTVAMTDSDFSQTLVKLRTFSHLTLCWKYYIVCVFPLFPKASVLYTLFFCKF